MLMDNPWVLLGTVTLGVIAACLWGWLVWKSVKNHGVPYLQLKLALTGLAIAASMPITRFVASLVETHATDVQIGPTSIGEVFGLCAASVVLMVALPHLDGVLFSSKLSFSRRALERFSNR